MKSVWKIFLKNYKLPRNEDTVLTTNTRESLHKILPLIKPKLRRFSSLKRHLLSAAKFSSNFELPKRVLQIFVVTIFRICVTVWLMCWKTAYKRIIASDIRIQTFVGQPTNNYSYRFKPIVVARCNLLSEPSAFFEDKLAHSYYFPVPKARDTEAPDHGHGNAERRMEAERDIRIRVARCLEWF